MNYRDFYKKQKQVQGAGKPFNESMKEINILREMDFDDKAVDDGLPKRSDGALNIEHDGRPIHLSKIIQVGAEFGNGPASGEQSGYKNVGVDDVSAGKDQSKDKEGVRVENDKEHIIAGGKPVDPGIASQSVGGEVTGGQEQGGPNTKGSIAGTPKLTGDGTNITSQSQQEDGVFSLQEARTKLREMVKEVLKEITFDKKSGKWVKKPINEGHDAAGFADGSVPGRPQYKIAGPQYRTAADVYARTRQYEPEITEMYDEEEECMQQERYNELVNAQRNLSESELSELKEIGLKLEKKDKFLKKAINPAHKGYCTPMTKKTCTPHRKALAKRFKKGGDLHKDETVNEDSVSKQPNHELSNWGAQYSVRDGSSQAEQPGQVMRARQIQKSPRVNEDGEDHPETNMDNPEEKSEVQIGQEIKSLADKLIGMHQAEQPEVPEQPTEPPVNEAGGGAVQHSSYRSAANDGGKGAHGNLPQGKQRWRNDVDEGEEQDETKKKDLEEIADYNISPMYAVAREVIEENPHATDDQLAVLIAKKFTRDTGWKADPEAVQKAIAYVKGGPFPGGPMRESKKSKKK